MQQNLTETRSKGNIKKISYNPMEQCEFFLSLQPQTITHFTLHKNHSQPQPDWTTLFNFHGLATQYTSKDTTPNRKDNPPS